MLVGNLIISLWREASAWSSPDRTQAKKLIDAKRGFLDAIFEEDDGALLVAQLSRHLAAARAAGDQSGYVALSLAMLRAFDTRFLIIHPRLGLTAASAAGRPRKPDWLEAAEADRIIQGHYAKRDGFILIPRGPLYRPCSQPEHSGAEKLKDRFAALSVVELASASDHRPISISLSVIGQGTTTGVKSPKVIGQERVAFIPVAKTGADLDRTSRDLGDERFVRIEPSVGFDVAAVLAKGVHEAGDVDIAVAPEFVVPVSAADRFSKSIAAGSTAGAKLTIAGSGNTEPDSQGRVWNEAHSYNSFGTPIWVQRKVWPAGIVEGRAHTYGLAPAGPLGMVIEDTAAGDTVAICDIEGVGRCLTLICQDIKAEPLARYIVDDYEPDWIFVPILDTGVSIGRWMHRAAYSLADLSQTRILIASSVSMCYWDSPVPTVLPAVGLAVGPNFPADTSIVPSRVVLDAYLAAPTDDFVIVQWGQGKWKQSVVSAVPIP